jgi:quercetin dioxygenase-like cupin family protein
MRSLPALLLGCVVVAGTTALIAQDAVKTDPAHYKTISENAAVRIVRVSYAPNDKSPMHSHPDSAVVILRGGQMQFGAPDGTKTETTNADNSGLYLPAGSHANQNVGKTAIDAILIEFKTPKPGTVVLPATRPGMTMTTLAEGPRAVIYKVVDDGKFAEPAGTKHDYDQVVIALEPGQMSLSLDGKPAKTTWARGDVQWIPRGMPHESKNTTGKPTTFAIVAVR